MKGNFSKTKNIVFQVKDRFKAQDKIIMIKKTKQTLDLLKHLQEKQQQQQQQQKKKKKQKKQTNDY